MNALLTNETTIVSLNKHNLRLRYVVKAKPVSQGNVIAFPVTHTSNHKKD